MYVLPSPSGHVGRGAELEVEVDEEEMVGDGSKVEGNSVVEASVDDSVEYEGSTVVGTRVDGVDSDSEVVSLELWDCCSPDCADPSSDEDSGPTGLIGCEVVLSVIDEDPSSCRVEDSTIVAEVTTGLVSCELDEDKKDKDPADLLDAGRFVVEEVKMPIDVRLWLLLSLGATCEDRVDTEVEDDTAPLEPGFTSLFL